MTGYAYRATSPYTGTDAATLPVFPTPLLSSAFTHWWDAKRLGLNAGDQVASWADELGSAPLTQATSGARPLLQREASGAPYVDFDGTDDYLSASFAWEAQPCTVMVVAKLPTAPASSKAIVGNSHNSGTNTTMLGASSGDVRAAITGSTSLTKTPAPPTGWAVFYAVFNGTSSVVGASDRTEATGTLNPGTASSQFILANYASAYTRLQVKMAAWAPAALDATARAAEVANLKTIFGIA